MQAHKSQSTIKMDKGYYTTTRKADVFTDFEVAIHNKNGQGLLLIKAWKACVN